MTGRASYPKGASVTLVELESDPHRVMAALRPVEPISWVPAIGGWLVSRRDLAIDIMRDSETFTVDDARFSTGQVVGPSMLSTDGIEHDRHRQPWVDSFRSGEVRGELGRWVADEAVSIVDQMAGFGSADLRSELAAPLAVRVVVRALGMQQLDTELVLRWYSDIVGSVTELAEGRPATKRGAESFAALSSAIRESAKVTAGSLLARLSGEGSLSEAELASNAAVVMFGGIETSEAMTASALFHLLSHPDQFAAVRDDRSLLANAIDESLRLEPGAASVDRYATRDVEIADARIASGDFVSVSLAGANRDPATFTEPDRFDITRANAKQHLTFVRGPHTCLGIHLAKLETRCAIEAVMSRLDGIELAPLALGPRGLVFRKPVAVAAFWSERR